MLPDYPEIKEKIANLLSDRLRRSMAEKLGFLGQIPKSIIQEGNRHVLIRDDGTTQETPYQKVSSSISITHDEMHSMETNVLFDKIDSAASELASQQAMMTFKTIDNEVSQAGNSVDANGAPFTAELFLNGLEKIQLDFDWVTQRPMLPSLVAHPSNMEKMKLELSRLDEDPTCRSRFESIIAKKKDEWIARESNRKLVG